MSGTTSRWITAAVLLVAALLAGLWLSGWLTLKLLGLSIPAVLTTYQEYIRAWDLPQLAPYRVKLKIAGSVGFGLPMLAYVFLAFVLFRSRPESLHGDAEFADMGDLKRAGMLDKKPESIVVGKYKGRYLYINGTQHVIVIAPTRSGKTTSLAIPVLLTYEHSMCVLDLKGELFKETSGCRAKLLGQDIYKWAPYATDGRTHRFNPLSFVKQTQYIADLQTIAAILYPDEPGKDSFWVAQPRAAFVAFASFLFENWYDMVDTGFPSFRNGAFTRDDLDPNIDPQFPSLERILLFSSGGSEGKGTKERLREILDHPKRCQYVSPQTRSTFSALASMAEETLSSIIATLQAPLQQFLNPLLAVATNATDFDVNAIRKRKTTIYCVIPTQKLDESSKLLNIFFSTVIGNNLGQQLGEDPALKYQMLMMMDEFTAMGRVDVWAKRISISASYGVRDMCIIQSQAQLRSVYGAEDAQNFKVNHAGHVVFTPREQEDANAFSEMLGYKTMRRKQRSYSHGAHGRGVNINYTEERRALMLPQEIKELPADDQLLFFEGCKPIRCKKNWFFKDAFFKQRILPPVEIPAMAAVQHGQGSGGKG